MGSCDETAWLNRISTTYGTRKLLLSHCILDSEMATSKGNTSQGSSGAGKTKDRNEC